jgi:hypothetical protein
MVTGKFFHKLDRIRQFIIENSIVMWNYIDLIC